MVAKTLFVLLLAFAAELSLASRTGKMCTSEQPNLGAGHIQLTDDNFQAWKKANSKLHVLGVSDSSCSRCCETEEILTQLQEKFDSKVYTGKKGKKLQIGRADLSNKSDFLRKEGLPTNDVPLIFVMHEDRYYRYNPEVTFDGGDTYGNLESLLHFINKLQHPLLPLESEEAIERFLDDSLEVEETTGFFKREAPALGVHYQELSLRTRVLVFMFDKDEYLTEMKMVREAGRLEAQRMSVRIGLVTDPKLIRTYKARKGNLWFNDDVQLSTIVLQRFDKQQFSLDFLQLEHSGFLVHWINKKSMPPVSELSPENVKVLEMVGQQVLVGVTHLKSKDAKQRDASKTLVEKTLEKIAPALYRGMSIATADFTRSGQIMQVTGMTEADLPFVYVTDPISSLPIIFRGALEPDAIRKWAQDVIKDNQESQQKTAQDVVHQPGPVADPSLAISLSDNKIRSLGSVQELEDLLAFEGDDICLIVYSSAIRNEMIQEAVGLLGLLMEQMGKHAKWMRFVAADLNQLGSNRFFNDVHPSVWLYPGKQRGKPGKQYRGELNLEQTANWIKQQADNKFKMNTKQLDSRIQVLSQAGLITPQGQDKPKDIMAEVEEELMRRGEL